MILAVWSTAASIKRSKENFKHRQESDVKVKEAMSEKYQDQEFLEYIVKSLVENQDDVKIDRMVDEMGVLLTLDVNPEDMGKIIGRQGNTAKAIRTLLRVIGMKHNARVNLKINEPAGGSGQDSQVEAGESTENNDSSSVDDAIEDIKSSI